MDTTFGEGVKTITAKIVDVLLTPVVWLLTGAALVMFFYGIAMFILNSDSNEKESGKKHMLWGLVGLLIIFAAWGILGFVGDTVNSLR